MILLAFLLAYPWTSCQSIALPYARSSVGLEVKGHDHVLGGLPAGVVPDVALPFMQNLEEKSYEYG